MKFTASAHYGNMPSVVPFPVHRPVILLVKTFQLWFSFSLEYAAGLTVLSIHVTLMTLTSPLCDVKLHTQVKCYKHRTSQ